MSSTITDISIGEQGPAGSPGLPVRLAATSPLPAYVSDSQGIIGQGNGALTIDSVAVVVGDDVLIAGESGSSRVNNRVCIVGATGDASNPFHLAFKTNVAYRQGEGVTVGLGTVNGAKLFILGVSSPIVPGTTQLVWRRSDT